MIIKLLPVTKIQIMMFLTYLLLTKTVHTEFITLEDFKAGNIRSYSASGSKTGNVLDAAAEFEYDLTSMYIMDEYSLSERLTLTFGARYDKYDGDDTPTNQSFLSTYGFKNGGITGTDLINLRFGADIIIDDVSDLNITFGTFSSKLPGVWISLSLIHI